MARRGAARLVLLAAAALGVLFLIIKGMEYADKAAQGITYETHPFFIFYYLLTGFHAAHLVAGVLILLLALFKARIILSRYLGLSQVPTWRRGFNLSLSLFCLMLLGLYLASGLTA